MHIDDPVLPAATELAGPGAIEVLRPAVTEAGGELHSARCVQLHYVPGRELVARYRCDIDWPTGRSHDTLLAATTARGHLPGTVPVTANTADTTLEAGVWRWPFDPIVTGLTIAATPMALGDHLRGIVATGPLAIDVVAYRPTERAVLRLTDQADHAFYLKVLAPGQVESVVARHDALGRAGIQVPEVLHADEANGLLLLQAMPGATLRDRIKSGQSAWPSPAAVAQLLDGFAAIDPSPMPTAGRASRTRDAIAHARFLTAIAPEVADAASSLADDFRQASAAAEQRARSVIHGDLHEAQIFTDESGAIIGVIDLDDLGVGDPLDDPAVLLGHLEYRAIADQTVGRVLRPRIAALHQHLATIHDPAALELTVAAVLVGLATGPFRAQTPSWRQLTTAVVEAAGRHASAARSVARSIGA